MLALVEPLMLNTIMDRPNLGCAMLIAACEQSGIKTRLVLGQTTYLREMFLEDSDEIIELLNAVEDDEIPSALAQYKRFVLGEGEAELKDRLKGVYCSTIAAKSLRDYLNSAQVNKLTNHFLNMLIVYYYHLDKLNHTNLRLIDRYCSRIINCRPDYIGFSLYNGFEPIIRSIMKRVKEELDIPIIVGGSFSAHLQENDVKFIFEHEIVDYLIIGQGEYALPNLIKRIKKRNTSNINIPNVCFKEAGKIIINEREVIKNLDELPFPDFSQFELDLYLTPVRILPLQAGRGCTWRKCAFCNHHDIYLGKYTAFSIKRIVETIEHYRNTYGCNHIAFHDEELPPEVAKAICAALIDKGIKGIYLYTYARLTKGFTQDVLRLMYRVGFRAISWGMESGCQRILDLMNKGTDLSTMENILRLSSEEGISNLCWVIFGFPGETKNDANKTVAFLERNHEFIDLSILQPFGLLRGSPIAKNPSRWNIVIPDADTKRTEREMYYPSYSINNYAVQKGMNIDETKRFFNVLLKKADLNIIKLASERFRFVPMIHTARMLCFLLSSFGLIDKETMRIKHKDKKCGKVFPVILGTIRRTGKKIELLPLVTQETLLINLIRPPEALKLNDMEYQSYLLSQGTHSFSEILKNVYEGFGDSYVEKEISIIVKSFFEKLLDKDMVIGLNQRLLDQETESAAKALVSLTSLSHGSEL